MRLVFRSVPAGIYNRSSCVFRRNFNGSCSYFSNTAISGNNTHPNNRKYSKLDPLKASNTSSDKLNEVNESNELNEFGGLRKILTYSEFESKQEAIEAEKLLYYDMLVKLREELDTITDETLPDYDIKSNFEHMVVCLEQNINKLEQKICELDALIESMLYQLDPRDCYQAGYGKGFADGYADGHQWGANGPVCF